MESQQVRTQTHSDGQRSVWEKWFTFGSGGKQYLSMWARWDPGMIVHRHGHHSPQVMFVLSGDLMCGDVHCPAGTHIELPHGAALGPLIAGPDGVELFEVMMGDAASWAADPEGFEALLSSRNITKLPDPPPKTSKTAATNSRELSWPADMVRLIHHRPPNISTENVQICA